MVRSAVRLKAVNTHFRRSMHIPAWLGVERIDVAGCTFRAGIEEMLSALRGLVIEAARRRRGSRQGQLIEVQRRQFRSDQVGGVGHVSEAELCGNWELIGIVQPWI